MADPVGEPAATSSAAGAMAYALSTHDTYCTTCGEPVDRGDISRESLVPGWDAHGPVPPDPAPESVGAGR